MSEDKRRSARTQSRFSSDKDIPLSRREKQKGSKKGSKPGEKANNDLSVLKTSAEGVSVEYQENSSHSFKELETKKKPEELRFFGVHDLSTTENGVSRLIYADKFLPEQQADELMTVLLNTTKWHDKNIVIRGEEYPQPRLVAWYGPFPYSYSGATLEAAEMPSIIVEVKQRIERFLKKNGIDVTLNSVLLNLYRNEKDSVAWHSDDELTMGVCPTIASISLGSIRKFEMRPKSHTVKQNEGLDEDYVLFVNLDPGSLIIMDGCMQKDWLHRVPKEYHDRPSRINLTFRTVYPIDQLPPQVPYSKVVNVSKPPDSKKLPEARLDDESFPPLGEPANLKNKTFTNNKASAEKVSSNHRVSPNGHQDTAMEYVANENENQNNLNKDLDCCTLEDSSHYNLMEPEKSSEVSNETETEASEKSYSFNNFSPKKVCLENDVQQFESAVENGNKLETQSQMENKHRFNINAPDFIPKNIHVADPVDAASEPVYVGYSLCDLGLYYESTLMNYEELMKFTEVLFSKIEDARRGSFFFSRDYYELNTLQQLSAGGQSEGNQRILLERICSIIQKCEFERQRDFRSPNRYYGNRTGGYGDNYRSREYTRKNSRRN